MSSPTPLPTPYRQIRALYTTTTITVYQAYSPAIAIPAVAQQNLSAAPEFIFSRMTWIKPSWCWMMYRSGYSFKDPNQAHILALTMSRDYFDHLLALASVSNGTASGDGAKCAVRVQWDPERDISLTKLPWRSVQVGIGRAVVEAWVQEGILKIEDVTGRAREIKMLLDDGRKEEASEMVPVERIYPLGEQLKTVLRIEETG